MVNQTNFNIKDHVEIILKEPGYFKMEDGCREVQILSKLEMKHELGLNLGWSEEYISEQFRKNGVLAIKEFTGIYVGDRPGVVKVKPLYGIQHPESEYFIMPEHQIEKIARYYIEE